MTKATRHNPMPVQEPYSGIYSYGVEVPASARTLYISGQIGQPQDGQLSSEFRGQCEQALKNVRAVLREANMDFDDIIKVTFFLVRREDMNALVDIRKELLDGVAPAITTVFVAGLVSEEWLVEIEVTACAT